MNFFSGTLLYAQHSNSYIDRYQADFRNGDYPSALKDVNNALEIDSLNTGYLLLKAKLLFLQANYDGSLNCCYVIQKLNPDNEAAFYLRGRICLVTGSYGGAIFFFKKVIESGKDKLLLCDAHIYRGSIYLKQEKLQEANEDLTDALTIKPDSVQVMLLLAETCMKLKQYEKAIEILEKFYYCHRI